MSAFRAATFAAAAADAADDDEDEEEEDEEEEVVEVDMFFSLSQSWWRRGSVAKCGWCQGTKKGLILERIVGCRFRVNDDSNRRQRWRGT